MTSIIRPGRWEFILIWFYFCSFNFRIKFENLKGLPFCLLNGCSGLLFFWGYRVYCPELRATWVSWRFMEVEWVSLNQNKWSSLVERSWRAIFRFRKLSNLHPAGSVCGFWLEAKQPLCWSSAGFSSTCAFHFISLLTAWFSNSLPAVLSRVCLKLHPDISHSALFK